METRVDLYRALRDLIGQIPEGMVSTPLDLADALGDRRAAQAVSRALQREELRDEAQKVTTQPAPGARVFREFSSDRPLKRLAEIQRRLSRAVVREDRPDDVELYAGVDAAYRGDEAYAVCVVLDSGLRLVESASVRTRVRFPYIPGYLAFREAPAVEAAVGQVSSFDVLLVNGHGVAHPRGCGLATHVGLDLDVAAVGVAKRRLVGRVGPSVDGWAPLIHGGRVVGARLTVGGRAPIYVSYGHNISLETSLDVVRRTMAGGRLPEPLHAAHRAAEDLRRRGVSGVSQP